jgi:L-aspartate oxidase
LTDCFLTCFLTVLLTDCSCLNVTGAGLDQHSIAFDSPLDVIVVGAGAAGLYTALCLPASLRVGLVTKHTLSSSASDWAQGGIAAVVDPNDSTALHLADTLAAGAGLCETSAVQFLVENAADCIANLVDMGVAFDRHNGQLAMTLEAAHSRRRVLHAADTTGRAVVTTLVEQVLQRSNIQILAPALVLDLWLDESGKRCQGVCLAYGDRIYWQAAGDVILATGGGGQVFAQTTNPVVSTGDGVAIAHRAGALLRDLEFVQFHPTALYQAGAPRFLISEAVRGEGAHLIDRSGRRFTFDYDPAGELAPRDVVSRAIFNHLQATESEPATANVWLDLRPIPAATIRHRFPNIIQVCQQWGIDVFTQPIPVAPAAHYWMGGVDADRNNQTSIAHLYAVGETASTGVHGANRLASNSLLECLVFGRQFSHFDPATVRPPVTLPAPPPVISPAVAESAPGAIAPTVLAFDASDWDRIINWRQALPKAVWQAAGICREAPTLGTTIAAVEAWQQAFDQLPVTQVLKKLLRSSSGAMIATIANPEQFAQISTWAELRNLFDVALLLLKSAEFRTESRGGHYRSDYPETLAAWQYHTLIERNQWRQGEVDGD